MELKFRPLCANEVECRVAQVKDNGVSILLYKDARVDQNILDEQVGPMNWQRHHTRDNANCIVSIWDSDKKQWIEKEDTGTESNTEKEKGLASDSFKRACFNWGIGRELYTAPFIWISSDDCTIREFNGKPRCYDSFKVKSMESTDGVITSLKIVNTRTHKVVFAIGKQDSKITEEQKGMLMAESARTGIKLTGRVGILNAYKIETIDDMTSEQYMNCMTVLKAKPTAKEKTNE